VNLKILEWQPCISDKHKIAKIRLMTHQYRKSKWFVLKYLRYSSRYWLQIK